MKTPKKFKFNLNGMEFLLPIKYLRTHSNSYNERAKKLDNPIIDICQVAAASILKQYVKKKYPNVFVSAWSDSYSGGCSTNVYLSDEMGNEVSEDIYKDVRDFGKMFQMGYFNGMEDIYEYGNCDYESEKGTKIEVGVSYVFVYNKPGFGSVPDVVKMITDMTTTDKYIYGKISLDKAIEEMRGYKISESKIKKALTLMNK